MHTTALLLTILSADLTPSADLAQRLDAADARRTSIDERRANAQLIRGGAAIGYAVAAGSLLWGVLAIPAAARNSARSYSSTLARLDTAPNDTRGVDPGAMFATSAVSLAVAIAFHVGFNTYVNQLDEEAAELDAPVRLTAR